MQKQFNTKFNVGKAKYVINFHDGVKTHKDGSPFFDIHLPKTKVLYNKKRDELLKSGYKETN